MYDKLLGYFLHKEDADKVFDHGFCYGFHKRHHAVEAVEVHEDLISFMVNRNEKEADLIKLLGEEGAKDVLRRRALAKLTEAERRALGL